VLDTLPFNGGMDKRETLIASHEFLGVRQNN
jgi:hypothetical protein